MAAPTRTDSDSASRSVIGDLSNRIRTVLFGDDPEPGSIAIVSTGFLALSFAVGAFLIRPGLFAYGVLAFLLVVGIGWLTYQAAIARLVSLVATVSTLLTIGFITWFLFISAVPAIETNGIGLLLVPEGRWFFWLDGVLPTDETYWNPSSGAVSLIPMIWGTVIVTIIAMGVAGPLGLFGGLFISEIAGARLRAIVKPGVEILAGIPSIVYGFIGFAILNNFVRDAFLDQVKGSFLIAGIVVGVMALPTVVSVSEDALSSVPSAMGDGSVAMGATKWQTMKSISVPAAFSGISAAVILGVGRAIGETMAVAAIMASGTKFANPLFDLFDQHVTLTSLIATQYGSAPDPLVDVLFVAGVLLFGIVATTSVVSQLIERRMKRRLRGQQ